MRGVRCDFVRCTSPSLWFPPFGLLHATVHFSIPTSSGVLSPAAAWIALCWLPPPRTSLTPYSRASLRLTNVSSRTAS